MNRIDKHLNIIALNIPWPPNYGGVIDIFYKVMALHALDVKITLHCFEYERKASRELELLCENVYYYKRQTGLKSNFTFLPYNVYSRKNEELIRNLLKNDYPILFEGLHSCYYISDDRLKNRKKIFRECNIEHDYYYYLFQSTNHPVKKLFFLIEALRFKIYQSIVKYADLIISVSTEDQTYLQKTFPEKHIEFVPCFHKNEEITTIPGKSDFILYHGKLSVFENEKAVLFLIHKVFSKLPYTCIIAGMDPSDKIKNAAKPFPNIIIEANPDENRMDYLIHHAQISTLITFQATGLKLKLLNSLFAGRHTLVNSHMLAGSGLEALCFIENTPEQMIRCCHQLMAKPFDQETIKGRENYLFPTYSNKYQAERLCRMIYFSSNSE